MLVLWERGFNLTEKDQLLSDGKEGHRYKELDKKPPLAVEPQMYLSTIIVAQLGMVASTHHTHKDDARAKGPSITSWNARIAPCRILPSSHLNKIGDYIKWWIKDTVFGAERNVGSANRKPCLKGESPGNTHNGAPGVK